MTNRTTQDLPNMGIGTRIRSSACNTALGNPIQGIVPPCHMNASTSGTHILSFFFSPLYTVAWTTLDYSWASEKDNDPSHPIPHILHPSLLCINERSLLIINVFVKQPSPASLLCPITLRSSSSSSVSFFCCMTIPSCDYP